MEKITGYKTADGQLFYTEEEAAKHEKFLAFLAVCNEAGVYNAILCKELYEKLVELELIL